MFISLPGRCCVACSATPTPSISADTGVVCGRAAWWRRRTECRILSPPGRRSARLARPLRPAVIGSTTTGQPKVSAAMACVHLPNLEGDRVARAYSKEPPAMRPPPCAQPLSSVDEVLGPCSRSVLIISPSAATAAPAALRFLTLKILARESEGEREVEEGGW